MGLRQAIRASGGLGASVLRAAYILRREGPRGLALRLGRILRPPVSYANWIARFDDHSERDRGPFEARLASLTRQPLISVVMPVYDTSQPLLDAAIRSVTDQIYPAWELCICDDASQAPHVGPALAAWAAREPRIRLTQLPRNGHISAASNAAFALSSGEWVVTLDHDDLLRPHALLEVALAAEAWPGARVIYSDEDKIDATGRRRFDPHFKPDWSPDLFRGCNYLNHLTALRSADIREAGGWRTDFEGAQDYDLTLRVIENLEPEAVRHIPKVLYHWRVVETSTAGRSGAKPYARDAAIRAVAEHLARTGQVAEVEPLADVPYHRVAYRRPAPSPLVTIMIPNRDKPRLLRACIDSVRARTLYPTYEILVIDNGSTDPDTLALYEAYAGYPDFEVLRVDEPFNFARMNNLGAAAARGDILVLLNNDVEVISPGWLDELTAHAARPEIGCVGAKLYYPDGTIQHAGVFVGVCGPASHPYRRWPGSATGYMGRLALTQNLSAVTAACLAVRREVWAEVGGMDDEGLKVAFNDVDFCLKVQAAGYLNLWTPHAELTHHESVSRGYELSPEKQERFRAESRLLSARWPDIMAHDPFYSPNLTRTREDVSLRASP